MPTSVAVQEQLTRIIVQVVGGEPAAVRPEAQLERDLGVDSLSVVEIAEQLGQVFDVYIPDDAVNEMVTVQDGINAIIHHDPAAKVPGKPAAPAAVAAPRRPIRAGAEEIEERKRTAWKFAGRFAVVGIALGVVLGFGGVALINATGLNDVAMPAAPTPTASKTTTKPTTPPTTTPPSVDKVPEPSLSVPNTAVSPGERIRLKGSFPELDKGATLQVQIRDKVESWDDFPVTTRTSDGGDYTTVIYTTRTGEREIRMYHKDTKTSTPAVAIEVG